MALQSSSSTLRHLGPSRRGLLGRTIARALLMPLALGGLLWLAGPGLLAPVEDFEQGPGGAMGYISLTHQIRDQSDEFWSGIDVKLRLSEEEFSGMLSSALLTGRSPGDPIQKVRGRLEEGEIEVETVVSLPFAEVPARFRGPLGLRLWLAPEVSDAGLLQFRITQARVGHLPIPPDVVRMIDKAYPLSIPSFDAQAATISLPLGEIISQSLGRKLEVKRFAAEDGLLSLTIAMPHQNN